MCHTPYVRSIFINPRIVLLSNRLNIIIRTTLPILYDKSLFDLIYLNDLIGMYNFLGK